MTPAALLALTYVDVEFMMSFTYLSDHTLRNLSWIKTIIETKPSDMRVSTDSLNSCEIFDLLHFGVNT
jgi:predicted ATPase